MEASVYATVLDGIRNLTANPPEDKATRNEVYKALKNLSIVIEDPHDTIYRVIHSPKVLTMARIAVDLGMFQILNEKRTVQVSYMAEKTSCDKILTGRILRFLASHDMVDEIDDDTFAANKATRTLSIEGFQAGIRHGYDFMLPVLSKTQEYFKHAGYKNPNNALKTPFQIAYQTDLHAIAYAMGLPELIGDFGLWMSTYHAHDKTWIDSFDLVAHCYGSDESTVIFVDVGGSIGHQCALLKKSFPDMKGRVILQDQALVLEQALQIPGVEHQAVDMWQGQGVKAAKVYYMRSMIHDYPDEACIKLMRLTAEAMSADSILLIDDIIIPNRDAHARATELDVEMMVTLASMERTDRQWTSLIDAAGFNIISKKTYIEGTGESIIAVAPK